MTVAVPLQVRCSGDVELRPELGKMLTLGLSVRIPKRDLRRLLAGLQVEEEDGDQEEDLHLPQTPTFRHQAEEAEEWGEALEENAEAEDQPQQSPCPQSEEERRTLDSSPSLSDEAMSRPSWSRFFGWAGWGQTHDRGAASEEEPQGPQQPAQEEDRTKEMEPENEEVDLEEGAKDEATLKAEEALLHEVLEAMARCPSDAEAQALGCQRLAELALAGLPILSATRCQEEGGCLPLADADERLCAAVPLVLDAMRMHPSAGIVQEQACAALALMVPMDNHGHIASNGGIELIVEAMRSYPRSSTVQEHACVALAALASVGYESKIASLGGVDIVMQAMRAHIGAERLQASGCRIFEALVSTEKDSTIVSMDSVGLVLEALREHVDTDLVQERGWTALAALALKSNQVTNDALCGVKLLMLCMGLNQMEPGVQTACYSVLEGLQQFGTVLLQVADMHPKVPGLQTACSLMLGELHLINLESSCQPPQPSGPGCNGGRAAQQLGKENRWRQEEEGANDREPELTKSPDQVAWKEASEHANEEN
mmetsp:Transcript_69587/g.153942  ORF Transcript_69587/g.153942 Transcript_69587/m.153942 type:complete len:541 (-) Transcript_69587:77-1699(-)